MPNSNTYIKKPIIKPNRICKLKECSTPFRASRQDQRFHTTKCAQKQWRIKHPRKRFHKKPSWKCDSIYTGAKNPRRDTPEHWLKYMKENPIYAAMVTRGIPVNDFCKTISWK